MGYRGWREWHGLQGEEAQARLQDSAGDKSPGLMPPLAGTYGHTGPVADMRVSGKPPAPRLIYRALTLTRPRSQAADEADDAIASRLRGLLAPFGLLIDEERWG